MNKRIKLSDANFEIMKIIWDLGEASVNDIHKAVQAERRYIIKRESIQVQVKRLTKYGWLKRRKTGKTFLYSAVSGQAEVNRDILKDVRDRVFSGSQSEIVRCLFDNTKISSDELARIRAMIELYESRLK